ncbi:hypothetical protein [Metallosphaera cuprina]|uniref:DUF4352 domain-containing protein n=1 Tax=Metallosphaera cuprina (strain Ar-4) TaxID=1006006 RepID=F4FY50_METCR|nr:hypothetical protein [Metallosphaera cuprina]AEB95423.1 conserved hypothetical protein [Metallosphaera cuprina Ar-4]
MGRILKSRRAISGAVTALILVIVSVALALAVAVFAFGLFGSFGSSGGQAQVIGTPQVSVTGPSGGPYTIIVNVTIKNSGSNPATIQSVTVANITATAGNIKIKPLTIPAGYDGVVNISISGVTHLPLTLANTNTGGSVPISIALTEGSLSPILTTQGILTNSSYT